MRKQDFKSPYTQHKYYTWNEKKEISEQSENYRWIAEINNKGQLHGRRCDYREDGTVYKRSLYKNGIEIWCQHVIDNKKYV